MKALGKYKGLALLVLLVVVAPLLVYRYSISGTVEQWRLARDYRRQIEALRGEQSTSGDSRNIETADTEMLLSGLAVAELLPIIEREKLRIEHFSPCVTSDSNGILLTTGQLSLRGPFAGTVRLLDALEREMPYCKIISANWRGVKPRNRGSTKTLTCTIYIQQIMTY
jgi:hypothetical protein